MSPHTVTLTFALDMDEVRKQIPVLQTMLDHVAALPVLIRGIQEHCPEPYRTEILAEWDKQRTPKGDTNE